MSATTVDSSDSIVVWDPLVRIFHWSLVAFFAFSYITGEESTTLHVISGYTILGLIAFRLVWGIIGTHYARFSQFIYRPSVILDYLKSLRTANPKHYLGHNPAGAAMIFILLSGVTLLAMTGLLMIGLEGEGPFAGASIAWLSSDVLKEIHEVIANGLLFAIAAHVVGVVFSSLKHKENLVRSMITGRKTDHGNQG